VNRGSMLGGGGQLLSGQTSSGEMVVNERSDVGAKPAELAHCHLMCTLRSTADCEPAAFEPVAIQPETHFNDADVFCFVFVLF
jgi:hypothetical protein